MAFFNGLNQITSNLSSTVAYAMTPSGRAEAEAILQRQAASKTSGEVIASQMTPDKQASIAEAQRQAQANMSARYASPQPQTLYVPPDASPAIPGATDNTMTYVTYGLLALAGVTGVGVTIYFLTRK